MPKNNIKYVDDNDDELATFTISSGYPEETKTKNKAPGRWITQGESITINGHLIKGGYFYFGGQLKALNDYATEASLVDESLKTKSYVKNEETNDLGYWPSYNSLAPQDRGFYLNWLASNRSNEATPLGYVFIYFYGLERRILLDAKDSYVKDDEYIALFNEIKRLHNIHCDSYSFLNYSSKLLEIMYIERPHLISLSEEDIYSETNSLLFKYQLANVVNEGTPISSKLALQWLKQSYEYNFRTPARRCHEEFLNLFDQKYTTKFNNGIVVKPNKTKLKLEYRPASSSLQGLSLKQKDLPDPSILTAPIKKLIQLADECTDMLDSYSRYLGRRDTSKSDIAAILLLPNELESSSSSELLTKFKQWADTKIANNNGLVSVSEFWSYTGTSLPTKINKKEAELIQNLAEKMGYGVAPDQRYHYAKPLPDGGLVLFNGGHGEYFEASRAFQELGMTLRLGAMVAQIDNNLDKAELNLLHQLIDHDMKLSPTDKLSLHSYLTWRLNTPSNMVGLKANLGSLGEQEKTAVSHILTRIALADGKVDSSEIKHLEKLYTLLGLDKSLVASDIHQMSFIKGKNTASISNLNPIPTSPNKHSGFILDESVLALHESETKDVQAMLNAIFIDQVADEEEHVPIVQSSDALDTPHQSLFNQIISKEKWTRDEFNELCIQFDLMIDGAIELINDWSFEKVDSSVIDEDDYIYIDLEIVEELKGSL